MTIILKRLLAVADMIIRNEIIADIGADHALLPLYLLEQQLIPAAIIGELGDGPYQRSLKAVQSSGMNDLIKVRQGDGLEVLTGGEVGTVVLAGMGGDTIVEILSRNEAKASSFKRYVFQPMSKAGVLRRFLAGHGWPIIGEQLIWENDKFFVVIASEPGQAPYRLSEVEMEIGREALQADNDIKRSFLNLYLNKYRKVYAGLQVSDQKDSQYLAADYNMRIRELEVILGASPS